MLGLPELHIRAPAPGALHQAASLSAPSSSASSPHAARNTAMRSPFDSVHLAQVVSQSFLNSSQQSPSLAGAHIDSLERMRSWGTACTSFSRCSMFSMNQSISMSPSTFLACLQSPVSGRFNTSATMRVGVSECLDDEEAVTPTCLHQYQQPRPSLRHRLASCSLTANGFQNVGASLTGRTVRRFSYAAYGSHTRGPVPGAVLPTDQPMFAGMMRRRRASDRPASFPTPTDATPSARTLHSERFQQASNFFPASPGPTQCDGLTDLSNGFLLSPSLVGGATPSQACSGLTGLPLLRVNTHARSGMATQSVFQQELQAVLEGQVCQDDSAIQFTHITPFLGAATQSEVLASGQAGEPSSSTLQSVPVLGVQRSMQHLRDRERVVRTALGAPCMEPAIADNAVVDDEDQMPSAGYDAVPGEAYGYAQDEDEDAEYLLDALNRTGSYRSTCSETAGKAAMYMYCMGLQSSRSHRDLCRSRAHSLRAGSDVHAAINRLASMQNSAHEGSVSHVPAVHVRAQSDALGCDPRLTSLLQSHASCDGPESNHTTRHVMQSYHDLHARAGLSDPGHGPIASCLHRPMQNSTSMPCLDTRTDAGNPSQQQEVGSSACMSPASASTATNTAANGIPQLNATNSRSAPVMQAVRLHHHHHVDTNVGGHVNYSPFSAILRDDMATDSAHRGSNCRDSVVLQACVDDRHSQGGSSSTAVGDVDGSTAPTTACPSLLCSPIRIPPRSSAGSTRTSCTSEASLYMDSGLFVGPATAARDSVASCGVPGAVQYTPKCVNGEWLDDGGEASWQGFCNTAGAGQYDRFLLHADGPSRRGR